MAQSVRHTTKYNDNTSTETLLAGEVVYTDSNTIKIGDGEHIFSQLPEFSSNESLGDGSTIVVNTAKKIQAHGTVNKNPNATGDGARVFDWIGTQQEFVDQQIETTHPEWLCFVTDDLSGTMSGTYTSQEIDAFLSLKANGVGDAVLTSGNQNIEGEKYFLNTGPKAKSGAIDTDVIPTEQKYLSVAMGHDKNGKRIGNVECFQSVNGDIGLGINSSVFVNGEGHYSTIATWINKDGTQSWTQAPTPTTVTANDKQIVTAEHLVNVLKAIYPVGSIYIGTQSTCPMGAFFGTWNLVSSGRALWGGDGTNGNTTIAAGLPNITGSLNSVIMCDEFSGTGSFSVGGSRGTTPGPNKGDPQRRNVSFAANKSSTIYGNSTTVQPPAYVVNVWRRSA